MKVFSHLKVLHDCINDKDWIKYDNLIDYLEDREHFNFSIGFIDFLLDYLFPYLENKGIYFEDTKNIMKNKREKDEKLFLKIKAENTRETPSYEEIDTLFNQTFNFKIGINSGQDIIRIFK